MAGYIGKSKVVTQVNGYTQTEADSNFVDTSGDTMTGDLSLGDNVKAKFGAGDDLQIYHDGSNSFITEAGTGHLYVQGTQLVLKGGSTPKKAMYSDGVTTYLYSNDSIKLATTSTGVDVTGTLTADDLTLNGTGIQAQIDAKVTTGPDMSPNAWHLYLGQTQNFPSANTALNFNYTVHKGSNLTASGGKITVSVAGMYLISFMGSRYYTEDSVWDWSIAVNSGEVTSSRAYVSGNHAGNYDSTGITVPVQLYAGDTVFISGNGYCYGSSNSMTYFTGVRLGA